MEFFEELAAFVEILLNGAEAQGRGEVGDGGVLRVRDFFFTETSHHDEVLLPDQSQRRREV